MADQLVKMSSQFGGLPMEQLIGGPLKAACNAQTLLAKASSDFIKDVGLNDDGKGNLSARTVDFGFNRPVQDAAGNTTMLTLQRRPSTTQVCSLARSLCMALWLTTAKTAVAATTAPSTTSRS